ncbi:MAG: cation diffusion facilitator family transporter [bacterium]|nr:cation diffusion facilitator family transporter [bacterium]
MLEQGEEELDAESDSADYTTHCHWPLTGDSSYASGEYRGVEKKKLKLSMGITGGTMVVEAVGGVMTNSLALLSDAGHMFTHLFALGVSLGAILIASRDPCHHRTYGLFRAEILAALFNSLFLFAVTAFIFYEGAKRLVDPQPVRSLEMLFVAMSGLGVNVLCLFILRGSHRDDLNVKGAFLHMVADTASSVAVVSGAVVLYFTNWSPIDPLLSIGISLVILTWAYRLFKDSVSILMESAPKGINIDKVSATLKKEVPEIQDIYDMHIWVITSNMYSLTAHISIIEGSRQRSAQTLRRINQVLNETYHIGHTTIQVETERAPAS